MAVMNLMTEIMMVVDNDRRGFGCLKTNGFLNSEGGS